MKSTKFGYIYVHIPKCAGTSIERVLLGHEGIDISGTDSDGVDNLDSELQTEYWVGSGLQHAPLVKCLRWPARPDPSFNFTFIRNPWDRMVSEYEYCRAGGLRNELECPYTFTQFCKKFANNTLKEFDWEQAQLNPSVPSGEIYKNHLICQHEFIDERIDFIGRFENLENDFQTVCNHLGFGELKLPVTNKTKRKRRYQDYYDYDTIELVRDYFTIDLEQFSYTYDDSVD